MTLLTLRTLASQADAELRRAEVAHARSDSDYHVGQARRLLAELIEAAAAMEAEGEAA